MCEYKVYSKKEIEEYEDLDNLKCEFIRKEIFGDCPHAGVQPTPYKLCKEIVDKLPDLNGKSVLVLFNPEFMMAVLKKYPDSKITMITGSETAEKAKFKGVEKVIRFSPHKPEKLEVLKIVKKQWDVVIGNPPFQDPKNKRNPLWKKFIEKSFKLAKSDGVVSLIHPSGWRKPSDKLLSLIKNNDLLYLKMNDQKDGLSAFGAGTRFDWYVVKKGSNSGRTIIVDEDGNKIRIDISYLPCIPHKKIEWFLSLFANDGENICKIIHSFSMYENRKKWMAKTKDATHRYPCVYATPANGKVLLYSSENKGHFGIKKFIFGKASPENGFYDKNGEYGVCNNAFAIQINNEDDAIMIEKMIQTSQFMDLLNMCKWSGFATDYRIFGYFKYGFWKEFINE